MSKITLSDKIYGSIYGAMIGDALGAPTEMRTRDQILDYFGGYVLGFVDPPDDVFAKGRKPGQVTDDFSIAYYLIKNILKNKLLITEEMGKKAIIEWANDEEFYPRFAGPTTMMAIEKIRNNEEFDPAKEFSLVNYNNLLTNGAAMKIFPIGLINIGNLDKVIEDVITVAKHTHFTNLALSGACAIACAVSEACKEDATIESVIDAGIYGAVKGEKRATEVTGKISAGPSIEKRILLAINVSKKASSFDELLQDLSDYVGTGVWVTESVPCVFGIISAYSEDTMKSIISGVNIGSDTDTIATMTGAILGALNGVSSLNADLVKHALNVNGINIKKLADELVERL